MKIMGGHSGEVFVVEEISLVFSPRSRWYCINPAQKPNPKLEPIAQSQLAPKLCAGGTGKHIV